MTCEELLIEFDLATRTAGKIIAGMPQEAFLTHFGNEFGPAECFVHTAQSEKFALFFILTEVGIGEPYVLKPPFDAIAAIEDPRERHLRLSALNLEGARRVHSTFSGSTSMFDWWRDNRQKTRGILSGMPEELYGKVISHPLVTLELPCWAMVRQLFIHHLFYHCGQATAGMKRLGLADYVPFPFGEIV